MNIWICSHRHSLILFIIQEPKIGFTKMNTLSHYITTIKFPNESIHGVPKVLNS